MKMKDILNARFSLQKLMDQNIQLNYAFEIAAFIDKCNLALENYGEEIKTLDEAERETKAEELSEKEVSNTEAIHLPASLNIFLSPADVKCLESLIHFEK